MNVIQLDAGFVTVLRLEGDLEEGGMNDVREALRECLKEQRCNIVLNMSKVGFVSYMGAGVLVEGLRHVRAFGGDMKLVGVNMYAQRLFRMAGIHKIFPDYESEAKAIQEYQKVAA